MSDMKKRPLWSDGKTVDDIEYFANSDSDKVIHNLHEDVLCLKEELKNRPSPSLPTELTAENGAKYLLIGEFFEEIELSNPNHCGCGCCDCCADGLDEPETYIQKVPVSWSTIKDIYSKIVSHYLPQPPKEQG